MVKILEAGSLWLAMIVIFLTWFFRYNDAKSVIDELSELADENNDDISHIIVQSLKKSIDRY